MVSSVDFHLQVYYRAPPILALYLYVGKNQQQCALQNILMVVSQDRVRYDCISICCPSTWNALQNDLNLSEVVTLGEFKTILKECEHTELGQCNCL